MRFIKDALQAHQSFVIGALADKKMMHVRSITLAARKLAREEIVELSRKGHNDKEVDVIVSRGPKWGQT